MTTTVGSEGTVFNPSLTRIADSTQTPPTLGAQGEALNSDLHGKYFQAAFRGNLFWANRTALTIPVIASTLVSVFSLWNPPGSGIVAEIVDTEIGMVLPTTVVDVVGWYFSTPQATAAGTFTTPGVSGTNYGSCRIGDNPTNKAQFYSAYTHSGTPVRVDMIGTFGATTNANSSLPSKLYDGRLLVPAGIVISVAMSTAAGTTTGLDLSMRWSEWVLS